MADPHVTYTVMFIGSVQLFFVGVIFKQLSKKIDSFIEDNKAMSIRVGIIEAVIGTLKTKDAAKVDIKEVKDDYFKAITKLEGSLDKLPERFDSVCRERQQSCGRLTAEHVDSICLKLKLLSKQREKDWRLLGQERLKSWNQNKETITALFDRFHHHGHDNEGRVVVNNRKEK